MTKEKSKDGSISAEIRNRNNKKIILSNNQFSTVEGIVITGRGKATKRKFEKNPHLINYFGRFPAKGTLNVCCYLPFEFLISETLPYIKSYDRFWPVIANDEECIAFRYRNCPLHIVEIISPTNLRSKFNLVDGDKIQLEGNFTRPNFLKSTIWRKFWLGRELLYYTDDDYASKVIKNPLSKWATQPFRKY